jgi:hypothetical protein
VVSNLRGISKNETPLFEMQSKCFVFKNTLPLVFFFSLSTQEVSQEKNKKQNSAFALHRVMPRTNGD